MTAPPTKEQVKAAADRAEARSRGEAVKKFLETAVDEGKANAEIERLAKLSIFEFEQEREAAAEELGVRVSVLDEAVKRQRKVSTKLAKPTSGFDPDELERSASNIIKHLDVLTLFAQDFNKVIAGEAVNGKLLYLVGTSRLFDKTMNAAIKGTSAGGKSEIRKRVLEFFPPESVVIFTSLSEKALIYYNGDFANKILSMGEATATEEQSFQDYLLRELMSEVRIRYPTVQKVGGELVAVTIEKNGPVVFVVTTTKSKVHPENETRMLSLEIDDSRIQTKSVLAKVALVEGLNSAAAQIDYKPWQDFQRWLEMGERRVLVPFADKLAALIEPEAVRLRRDIGQVIRAIKAHALLHRDQRGRDDAGQIVADIDNDYATVRELMNGILAEGSGVAVNVAMTETIDAVIKATADMTEAEGASAQDIARILKLDKSAAWRRLSAARQEGFVVNLEQRKGMPGRYRVTGQKVEPVNILPEVATLLQSTHPTDTPPKSAQTCNLDEIAETSQVDNGCKPPLQPFAIGAIADADRVHECNPVANGLATDNPLNSEGKSLPVARWQRFLKGVEADTTPPTEPSDEVFDIPAFLDRRAELGRVCAQCGAGRPDDLPTVRIRDGDRHVWVHDACRRFWLREHPQ